MSEEPLRIYITIDLDPDQRLTDDNDDLSWEGVSKVVPKMIETFDRINGDDGLTVNATWFARVDDRVAEDGSDLCWQINNYSEYFDNFLSRGDYVAWHPHLEIQKNNKWITTNNIDDIGPLLDRGHSAFLKMGYDGKCVRLGGNAGSNLLFEKFESLGIKIDSSAIPGRRRNDGRFNFDWEITPSSPYFPSLDDYRTPGKRSRSIIEVPLTTVKINAEYDEYPLLRYLDLSFHPELIIPSLPALTSNRESLVLIVHPYDLLEQPQDHGLVSNCYADFETNLTSLIDAAHSNKRNLVFRTLRDYLCV